MDFLKLVLFESPVWLGGACFCLFGVVLFMRPRMNEAARNRSLPVFAGVVAGLFILQSMVVTDCERILAQMDAFVASVEASMRKDLAESTREVDLAQWKKRPLFDKLRSWVFYLVRKMM